MTYDAQETGIFSGRPVNLFEFLYTTEKVWRFTNAATQQVSHLTADIYYPTQISRSEIQLDGEINKNNIDITVPHDNDLVRLFIAYPPVEPIVVNVYRQHVGGDETILEWSGRVLNFRRQNSEATMVCEPISTAALRSGLKRYYSPICPHALYGEGCWVSKTAHRVVTTIDSLDSTGTQVSIAHLGTTPDNYFSGGILEFIDEEGILASRALREHTATVARLAARIQGLEAGSTVRIYPGCNRTLDECENKFDNILNNGAFNFVPYINPFDGATLF